MARGGGRAEVQETFFLPSLSVHFKYFIDLLREIFAIEDLFQIAI